MDLVSRTKKKPPTDNSVVVASGPSSSKPQTGGGGGVGAMQLVAIALLVGIIFFLGRPTEDLNFFQTVDTTTRSGASAALVRMPTCPEVNNATTASLLQTWKAIDEEVAKHPKTRVSGGIFLYPRQTALIKALVEFIAQGIHAPDRPLTVCETGFGAGHSSALFLDTAQGFHPNGRSSITLHAFDKFDRPYQLPALTIVQQHYPGHNAFHYTGDSCRTVPRALNPVDTTTTEGEGALYSGARCDILHASSLCPTDNIDLVENSPCGVLLTTTAMDSLTDNVVYFGPKGQWTRLRERGCIRDITCFREEKRKLDRTFVFSKNGAVIDHRFCFAITTGKCQKQKGAKKANANKREHESCGDPLAEFTKQHLRLGQLCKSFQVPIPK